MFLMRGENTRHKERRLAIAVEATSATAANFHETSEIALREALSRRLPIAAPCLLAVAVLKSPSRNAATQPLNVFRIGPSSAALQNRSPAVLPQSAAASCGGRLISTAAPRSSWETMQEGPSNSWTRE